MTDDISQSKREFKRILVTGGCGFLGQWLVKDLLDKYNDAAIRIIDLKKNNSPVYDFTAEDRVTTHTGKDIRSLTSIIDEFAGIDAVFHLAGLVSFSLRDREKLFSINVQGTKNVIKAAITNNVKLFIHISSTAALGYNQKNARAIDEEYKFDFSIARKKKKYYMLTKHLADLEVEKAISDGLNAIILHPALMYGPGDRHNSSRVIQAIKAGRIPFNMPGGNNLIDVRDVSRGLMAALEKGAPGRHYLLSGHNLSFRQINRIIAETVNGERPKLTLPQFLNTPSYLLFHLIEMVSRKKLELTADDIDSAFKFRFFDNRRAGKELNWEPQIPFETTIKDAADWLELK